MKYYAGKRYGYRKIFPEDKWEKNPVLLEWFRELNEEKFSGKLPEPKFLIFSEENKKTNKLKIGGSIETWMDTEGFPKRCYGIYISVEIYLYSPEQSRKTLLHEMVHEYCKENLLDWNDGSVDFIYNCGKFGAELYWNLDRKSSEVLNEVAGEKESLEIHINPIDISDLI
jgi:hypothetical protein